MTMTQSNLRQQLKSMLLSALQSTEQYNMEGVKHHMMRYLESNQYQYTHQDTIDAINAAAKLPYASLFKARNGVYSQYEKRTRMKLNGEMS